MFFSSNFRVGLLQIDNNSLLNNQGILSILEEAADMHSASIGYGVNDISKTNLSWILLNWKVQIFKRPKYSDKVLVKTWTRLVNKFYTYRDFEVYDENNNLLIIATSKWILIDAQKRSIARIEDSMFEQYLPENKSVFNIVEIPKLKEPDVSKETCTYCVRRNDIDVNGHMHNINYLSLAYEALPYEIYKNSKFNNFEILYKREIKLGDTVKCLYTFENDSHIITIKSSDLKSLHAIVKLS